ncbi:MAG TPA: I78 family peptidase inhibitor [Paenirhodobacter sp.]
MIFRFSAIAMTAVLLAGCQSTTEEITPAEPLPVPHMTPAVSQDGALEQRSPDLCGARNYASVLGQPSAVIPSLGITGPISVVEWRGIEPQEYSPKRVVFRLDQMGNIFNIDCG